MSRSRTSGGRAIARTHITGAGIAATTATILFALLWLVLPATQSQLGYANLRLGVLLLAPPLVAFAHQLTHREVDVLSPWILLPLTTWLTFAAGPTVLLASNQPAEAELLVDTLSIGALSYFLGVFTSLNWARQRRRPTSVPPVSRRAILIPFAVGACAMAWYWARAGGIPAIGPDSETARIAALTGSGIPFYLSMLLMVSVWIMAAGRSDLPRPIQLSLAFVAVVLLASTGWRNVPFALLAVSLLLLFYRRVVSLRTLILGVVMAVVGAVGFGIYRAVSSGITHYETSKLALNGQYGAAIWVYLRDYTATFSRNLVDVVQLAERSVPEWGETFVWNILALMPGSDREPFDLVLKQRLGLGFQGGGLPPTMMGELLLNFGQVGLIIGMFLIGILASRVHGMLSSSSMAARIVAALTLYFMVSAIRGGIGNVLFNVLWLSLATVAILAILSPETSERVKR
ncbi:oligosaccharide repeat unit polymerase [Nocardioides sp. T5]|uniref:oligosaccharide repeat unit polymerase n=1 Tax=Nocardioides sp. T5 TaxID=3400182 RepID=UPI003A8453F7